jgi:hypothetical protein
MIGNAGTAEAILGILCGNIRNRLAQCRAVVRQSVGKAHYKGVRHAARTGINRGDMKFSDNRAE